MSHILYIAVIFACLSGSAMAQGTASAKPCNTADADTFDPSKWTGTWYEVAISNDAPLSLQAACKEIQLKNVEGTKFDVTIFKAPLTNLSQKDNVTLKGVDFGINFENNEITWRFLSSDSDNVAYLCGITGADPNKKTFGVIWSKKQILTSEALENYKEAKKASFSNFGKSMNNTVQTDRCFKSASNNLQFMAPLVIVLFALLKTLH